MLRIKLADSDRERYGLPEWIDYTLGRPLLSEIRKVKAQVGWEWSQLTRDVDSDNPDAQTAARAVLVWVAVNRHNQVSFDDFELDVFGVEFEVVKDPNSPAPTGADS